MSNTAEKQLALATVAGGCFWCVEADLLKLPGVVEAVSGYAGGTEVNPKYEQVASGATSHREAVQVRFDPAVLSYADLLRWFFQHMDPTDAGGSFADRGHHYTSAVFYHSAEQEKAAKQVIAEIDASGQLPGKVVTEVLPFTTFYPAEGYHQGYFKTNASRYNQYRTGSGRDRFIERNWGKVTPPQGNRPQAGTSCQVPPTAGAQPFVKPLDMELKKQLSPMQYKVTQHEGTEQPFNNQYWDNHEQGIYVDVVSGEALFSSADKFDSGTGWPSFTKPLDPGNLVEKEDRSLFALRTEVRSKQADSHLGHVFPDGPAPTGMRYCMNSAALRFIPKDKLVEEGYGQYLKLFEKKLRQPQEYRG